VVLFPNPNKKETTFTQFKKTNETSFDFETRFKTEKGLENTGLNINRPHGRKLPLTPYLLCPFLISQMSPEIINHLAILHFLPILSL